MEDPCTLPSSASAAEEATGSVAGLGREGALLRLLCKSAGSRLSLCLLRGFRRFLCLPGCSGLCLGSLLSCYLLSQLLLSTPATTNRGML